MALERPKEWNVVETDVVFIVYENHFLPIEITTNSV